MVSISFSLSKRRPKDTRENILATKEFTVSIVTETIVDAANSTSVESPVNTDEWIISGLNQEPSVIFLVLWHVLRKLNYLSLSDPSKASICSREPHWHGMRSS